MKKLGPFDLMAADMNIEAVPLMDDTIIAIIMIIVIAVCRENRTHATGVLTLIVVASIGGSRGGRARRAPPHLPGILVFDDILGHIV